MFGRGQAKGGCTLADPILVMKLVMKLADTGQRGGRGGSPGWGGVGEGRRWLGVGVGRLVRLLGWGGG